MRNYNRVLDFNCYTRDIHRLFNISRSHSQTPLCEFLVPICRKFMVNNIKKIVEIERKEPNNWMQLYNINRGRYETLWGGWTVYYIASCVCFQEISMIPFISEYAAVKLRMPDDRTRSNQSNVDETLNLLT